MNRTHQNTGFTLAEIIVTTAIVGLVFFLSSDFMVKLVYQKKAIENTVKIFEIRDYFVELIRSPTSWAKTLDTKPFNCLKKGICGSNNGFMPFTPLDAEGSYFQVNSIAYKPNISGKNNQGFTQGGSICDSFKTQPSSPQCPFRFEFHWKPLCSSPGSCQKPILEVQIRFLVTELQGSNYLSFDPSLLEQTFYIGQQLAPVVPSSCPVGEVVTSIDQTTGFLNCQRLDSFP